MSNYLAHHGVRGQRWGFRRYQYEDGSLTSEGRRHYGYGESRSSVTSDTRAQIKVMREQAKAQRALVKENARAERKMQKQLYQEKVKDERRRQKENERRLKLKNANRDKRSKEYVLRAEQRAKELEKQKAEQKKQIAEFKKSHPLQYNKLKKYLREDGTLNEAGQALYFGNGKKKQIYQMSTEDLKKTTERLYAEKNYKQAQYELHKNDPINKFKGLAGETLINSGLAFTTSFAANSYNSAKEGKFKAEAGDNAKKALGSAAETAGITLTRKMGLGGKKGNKAYNAFSKRPEETLSDKVRKKEKEAIEKATLEDAWNRAYKKTKESFGEPKKSARQEWLDDKYEKAVRDWKQSERASQGAEYSRLFADLVTKKLSDSEIDRIINRMDEIFDAEPDLWYENK